MLAMLSSMEISLSKYIWIFHWKIDQILPLLRAHEWFVNCTNRFYGLRQASQQCFTKFSESFLSLDFVQSTADYSLFIRGSGTDFVVLLVYVDDITITGASLTNIENLKVLLP